MKFPQPIPVAEIARWLGAEITGDEALSATGINEIHQVETGDITFSDVKKYFDKAFRSAATVILLNEKVAEVPPGKCALVCPDPFAAFSFLLKRFSPEGVLTEGISPQAEIHPTARIGPGAVVSPFSKIGEGSVVGANSFIGPMVEIGERCLVGANSSIGTEAFYFKKRADGSFEKWPCAGRVLIENDVELGPGCTIARGVTGDTVIGAGVKIDAQCHFGHEVKIGKNCLIAAQVGIAGNTEVGEGVVIFGQVGIAQNLKIGAGAVILAKSGVSKDLPGGRQYFGYPAEEAMAKYRELAAVRRLLKG